MPTTASVYSYSSRLTRLLCVRQLDHDGVALYLYGIRQNILASRATQDLAGAYIELGAMPGTGEHIAIKLALVEWAADVRAVVGEGVNFAIDFCQADRLAIYLYGHQLTIL